jgi:hypothetical protein
MPGRAGDIAWALPSCRAIAEATGSPVDLLITHEFAPLKELLRVACPYLANVEVLPGWNLVPPREWDAPIAEQEGVRLVHLGYRGWPDRTLPHCIYEQTKREYPDLPLAPLDLDRPWLEIRGAGVPCEIAVGWTETYFELKYGLTCLLADRPGQPPWLVLAPPGGRWDRERRPGHIPLYPCRWLEAARAIRNADLFFGDCSALHVIAVALGKRCVLVEPQEGRLNSIFWPMDESRVTCVRGSDGLPTFDARHCADTLKRVLSEVSA